MGGWLVGAKIKDQQGLMKYRGNRGEDIVRVGDRVREGLGEEGIG